MNKQMKRIAAIALSLALLLSVLCSSVLVASAEETESVQATTMDLNRKELFLRAGGTYTLKPQILPAAADRTGMVWTSDNEDVAFVSAGTVYAVSAGEATITATTANGLEDTCKVAVANGNAFVKNARFEDEDLAMWETLGTVEIGAELGKDESIGAKITYDSAVSQSIEGLEANTTYVVYANLKCDNDKTIPVCAKVNDEKIAETELSLGMSWGSRSWEFTTPAELDGAVVIEYANPNIDENVWLDNVLVFEKLSGADLIVDSLTWTGGYGQVDPDTELTFTVKITNEGTVDLPDAFTVDIAAGTTVIQQLTYDKGVKAGETVEITATEPWTAIEGDFMMSATVNPEAVVSEANYMTNNTYQINLRVKEDRVTPAYDEVAQAVTDAGMHNLTFNEDFDDLSGVDTLASGEVGYKWYVTRRWAQTDMTREDYYVEDGVFRLQHKDCTYAIGASTQDTYSRTGYVYNKGYLEVKLRIPQPADGEGLKGKPAIWSLPPEKWCEIPGKNKHWVEVDWLEYYGDGSYTVTLHEQEYDADNKLTWHSSGDNFRNGLDDAEWHVMGFLWKENGLECYLDGKPLRSQTWGEEEIPMPVPVFKQGEIKFEGVFSILNTQENMLYLAGGPDMSLDVDYIRVWQIGGEPIVDEEEESTDKPEKDPEEEEPKPEEKPEEEEPKPEEKPVEKPEVETEKEEPKPEEKPEEKPAEPEKEPEEDTPKPEEIPQTGAPALPLMCIATAAVGVWVSRKRK